MDGQGWVSRRVVYSLLYHVSLQLCRFPAYSVPQNLSSTHNCSVCTMRFGQYHKFSFNERRSYILNRLQV